MGLSRGCRLVYYICDLQSARSQLLLCHRSHPSPDPPSPTRPHRTPQSPAPLSTLRSRVMNSDQRTANVQLYALYSLYHGPGSERSRLIPTVYINSPYLKADSCTVNKKTRARPRLLWAHVHARPRRPLSWRVLELLQTSSDQSERSCSCSCRCS